MATKITSGKVKISKTVSDGWDPITGKTIYKREDVELEVGVSGATTCINGDGHPATIIAATVDKDGFAVTFWIQADNYKVKEGCGGEYEGPKPCDFSRNPEGSIRQVRRMRRGWTVVGNRYLGVCLGERFFSYNPHV